MVLEVFLSYPMLSTTTIALCTLWLYTYFTCGVCKSTARMDGKTVIVTGSSAGIGKATAMDLARRGARVIMACRNLEKANKVKDEIVKSTKNTNVVVRLLDLKLMKSVRAFAEEVNSNEERLDVLIHNAAVNGCGRKRTEEGLNPAWATNHFGPFLLTILLINILKRTERSRVIFVTSYLHAYGSVDLKNPDPPNNTPSPLQVYCSTKFANTLCANELARRLKGSGVTVNCLHPGAIHTNIWENIPLWVEICLRMCVPFFKTVEQGAQTTIYLAVSEEVEGVSGKYFSDCKESIPVKRVHDVNLARKYWTLCEEIVQLQPSDPQL